MASSLSQQKVLRSDQVFHDLMQNLAAYYLLGLGYASRLEAMDTEALAIASRLYRKLEWIAHDDIATLGHGLR
jgi:hypothetical protein